MKNGDFLVKDLRVLKNRRLQDIVVVDNTVVSLRTHLDNVIYVPGYRGQKGDKELRTIMEFLVQVASAPDVRPYVSRFAGVKAMYKSFLDSK